VALNAGPAAHVDRHGRRWSWPARDVRPESGPSDDRIVMQMFIRYYVELPLPADLVAQALTAPSHGWVSALALDADQRGSELLAEVGMRLDGRLLGTTVRIELGEATRLGDKTVLPMSWQATGGGGLFPAMDGDLEVAPLGAARTQLAMSARYQPPLGRLGTAMDRAVLHRVAEATIKDFVDRVAQTLTANVVAG
jgi:hypothetical protein